MDYISTRGRAPVADFETVLTAGLAPDGGLYVPAETPTFDAGTIEGFADKPYAEIAAEVLATFIGDAFAADELKAICEKVYAGFDHPDVAPLRRVGDEDWILELFHGPTLAFKDFAMQLLGALFEEVLSRRGEKLMIIAATSGDTGAAAIHALAPCKHVNVVVLHPKGRVTDVQRRMMTTVDAPNVLNIAVAGAFDDCQAIVKQLFADKEFARQVSLSGVNSINWARLAAQTVYYFSSAARLGSDGGPLSFVVPTGNFGDVFAGYEAKQAGLDAGLFGIATNSNDILHRALSEGDYSPVGVRATMSPSMDIQVASNFERLLFDANQRDAEATRAMMEDFAAEGRMRLPPEVRDYIARDFVSHAASEKDTTEEMRRHYHETGSLIDPHTAVARVAAKAFRETGVMKGRIVTLSTAHPAKFPDAVYAATGARPELTPAWDGLFDKPEFMETAPAEKDAIAELVVWRFG